MTSERVEGFTQQLVAVGADTPFMREGLLFLRAPEWIVRAYVEARYARADVAHALAVACIGENDAALCRANPKLMIWTMARAWTSRLGELERKVRSLPAVAA